MLPVQPRRLALVLAKRYAEVLSPSLPGKVLLRRSFEETEDPAELAEHAHQVLRDLGERRRSLVLLLEDGLTRSVQLRLPPVPESEVRLVLERQLDRTLEEPQHFLAECLEVEEDGAGQWRVAAVEASFHRELLGALRTQGIEVQGTHSLDQALLAACRESLVDVEASACVIFGEDHVLVGLQNREATLRLAVLPLREDHEPDALAIGVTQELRNLAAFWRKESRGGELDSWQTLGGTDAQIAALQAGALTALGGAAGNHVGGENPRQVVLEAVLKRSARDLDLAPGLTPRRSRVALLSGVASAVLASLLALQLPDWRARVIDNDGLLEQASLEQRELARLSAQRFELEQAKGQFEGELERMAALSGRGLNYGEFLLGVTRAFEGRATLMGIDAGLGDDGRDVQLNAVLPQVGVIDSDALQRLRSELESLPFLESVEIILASQLPNENTTEAHSFEVRGKLAEAIS